MSDKYVAVKSTRLSASISSSATSLTVAEVSDRAGNTLTMTDFGSIGYGVIEPGGASEEHVSFTGISSTTISGLTRGLAMKSPYTNVAANQKAHSAGVTVILYSNLPAFYNDFANKNNAETIVPIWTFNELPTLDVYEAPTNSAQFAPKGYVDASVGGTVTTDRVVEAGTAGETLSAGQLVYLKASDGRWYKASTSVTTTSENVILGIAQGAGTAGNTISSGVLRYGLDANQTGLTANTKYFLADAAGTIATSAGTLTVAIGYAKSTTQLYFAPGYDQKLIQAKLDALAGSSGTPSSTNKYMTQADVTRVQTYAATSSGNDTYVITPSPAIAAYADGQVFKVKLDVANTGPATLNVNALGAIALVKGVSTALVTGDLVANQIVTVVYNSTGTVFQIVQAPVLLTDGSTLTDQHFHSRKAVTATRDLSTTSGNQTIAHGLGVTPKWVRVSAFASNGTGTENSESMGVYDGSTTAAISKYYFNGGGSTNAASSTTNIVSISDPNGAGVQVATATFDATNVTLAWTKSSGSPTGTAYMLVEVGV